MARQPSTRAHNEVLEAALALFSERGIDATSMDAISGASGVSKATIYKHWADKDALCLEVLSHLSEDVPVFESKNVRADIVAALSYRPQEQREQRWNRLLPHLMAYAARNRAFGVAWRARLLEPSRKRLTHLLKRAIAEGKLPTDLDLNLAVALLLGPMMYRHALVISNEKLPEKMPERVVEAFWRAFGIT